MTKRRSITLFTTIILVSIGIMILTRVIIAHHNGGANKPRNNGPVAVAIDSVRTGEIIDLGSYTGSLKAVSEIVVAPKITGRLEKLHVRLGDVVHNGQLLAELDPGTYEQTLDQAKADLAVAKANVEDTRGTLKTTTSDYEAGKSMFTNHYIAQSDLDQLEAKYLSAKAKFDIATADVQHAQAAVKSAQIQLSYTQLRATWNGGASTRVIGERDVEEGALLTANMPVVTVLDNSTMTAEIDVIEKDYGKLHVGQSATITADACPGRQFEGKVARIAPQLSEASRQARVEVDIPNTDGALKPGMFVRLSIEYGRHENATLIPTAALTTAKGQQGVFLLDRTTSKVSFVPVTTGFQDGNHTEVLTPALHGEVVTTGNDQLADGKAVRLPKAGGEQRGQRP